MSQKGHYRNNCPRLRNREAAAVSGGSPNLQGGQRPNPNNANHRRGHGRGKGIVARSNGNGRGGRAYASNARPTIADEANDHGRVHAAIDNLGACNQYAMIQTPANHQGVSFELLIDCGSTHSFLSPRCLKKLKLNQLPA